MKQNFPSGMKIGLIAMAAKPLHAGHFMLIEQAARENDEALVYVSTADRIKPGQYPITGQQMLQVWQILETIIPHNVSLTFTHNPTRELYEQLGAEETRIGGGDWDVAEYKIYSDPEDMGQNYPTKSLMKYFQNMWLHDLLTLQPISRTSTVNVSGTQMRKWLAEDNQENFMQNLPDALSQQQRQQIWGILKGQ
jgi:cytidyltransferase-like protein